MNERHGARLFGLLSSFILGAVAGAVIGAVWGSVRYGGFEIGYLYNYVLGCALILGFVSLGIAALLNWRRRNPLP